MRTTTGLLVVNNGLRFRLVLCLRQRMFAIIVLQRMSFRSVTEVHAEQRRGRSAVCRKSFCIIVELVFGRAEADGMTALEGVDWRVCE